MDDHELLRRYAEGQSEDAFRQLVERHGGLVYGVALRRLGQPHQAEEVAHAVFLALARKAGRLASGTVVAGWLFRATRFATAKLQRDEERHQRRQQEAAMILETNRGGAPDPIWEQVAPLLDDELAALGEKDRHAVLLRFFENRNFREVGVALGASEDAAKMRVTRALQKLRERLARRGVALPVAALAMMLGNQATVGATLPAGLAPSLAKAVVVEATAASLAQATLQKLAWWQWRWFVGGATALAIVIVSLAWRFAPRAPTATANTTPNNAWAAPTPAPPPAQAPAWPPANKAAPRN